MRRGGGGGGGIVWPLYFDSHFLGKTTGVDTNRSDME